MVNLITWKDLPLYHPKAALFFLYLSHLVMIWIRRWFHLKDQMFFFTLFMTPLKPLRRTIPSLTASALLEDPNLREEMLITSLDLIYQKVPLRLPQADRFCRKISITRSTTIWVHSMLSIPQLSVREYRYKSNMRTIPRMVFSQRISSV